MTYRTRLAAAFLVCTVVPVLALGLIVQYETGRRIEAQFAEQSSALARVVADAIEDTEARTQSAVADILSVMAADNRLRAALLGDTTEHRYLIDYAAMAMARAGLDALVIQDSAGTVVSSGHFRNDFGRRDAGLAAFVGATDRMAIVTFATAADPFVALVGADTLRIAASAFVVTGGLEIDAAFLESLAAGGNLRVTIDGVDPTLLGSPRQSVSITDADRDPETRSTYQVPRFPQSSIINHESSITLRHYDATTGQTGDATVRIASDPSQLEALRADVQRWFLIVIGIAVVVALIIALWLAAVMSRPIVELAEKAERVNFERLTQSFRSTRKDEVGLLERRLGQMARRLQQSASTIREAERRATLGDIARQVNHDIRNGLTPIRNVVRHLGQLVKSDPQKLPAVFAERERTLASSIDYLDELAQNYAKISSKAMGNRCDLNALVQQVADDVERPDGVTLSTRLGDGTDIAGASVSVRRIIENLVRNAVQSIETTGDVEIATERLDVQDDDTVRLSVTDTGRGMSGETRARIFDDFFTTRAAGTGLGLSIVRRIVMDLDGSISVESEEGQGSRFTVDFPAYNPKTTESDADRTDR